MNTIEQEIQKLMVMASDYVVYHKSYTSAVTEIHEYVEKKGFQLDPDEVFMTISTGPKKPSDGHTNRFTLLLYKNNLPAKKGVSIQVYGRGDVESPYELNMYFVPVPISEYTKEELTDL
jgi:hypothetical protein